jgi:hypothetical protein
LLILQRNLNRQSPVCANKALEARSFVHLLPGAKANASDAYFGKWRFGWTKGMGRTCGPPLCDLPAVATDANKSSAVIARHASDSQTRSI